MSNESIVPVFGTFDRDTGALKGVGPLGVAYTPLGGTASVGTFTDTTALQTAYPAAANLGKFASVGSAAPYTQYTSNGQAWVTTAGSGSSNVGTFVDSSALQTAFPAAANLGKFANVGATAPYVLYTSNGQTWGVTGGTASASVGTFATSGALQTAFPANVNLGKFASVGSAAPYTQYTSDGQAWVAVGTGTGGGAVSNPFQITVSRALTSADNGATLYTDPADTANYALSVPPGLGVFAFSVVQHGSGIVSVSNGVGVLPFGGSTAGPETILSVARTSSTAELYTILLPSVVPPRATDADAAAGTDTVKMMTPETTAYAITARAGGYAYVGLYSGLAAAVPTPSDGTLVKLTDTSPSLGGTGGVAVGTDWYWVASKGAWFPRNIVSLDFVTVAGGVTGAGNATAQVLVPIQVHPIMAKTGHRFRLRFMYGKSGSGGVLNYIIRMTTSPTLTTGSGLTANGLTQSNTVLKTIYENEFKFVTDTTIVETGGSATTAGTATQIGPVTVTPSTMYINLVLTPTGTDVPAVFQATLEYLPYGGV